jgi:acetyl-CoA acetyltransferase
MKPKSIAIVGAAETTELGRITNLSQIGLHADAALNAMKDAGIGPKDIDGVATAGETPVTIAHYLGITPKWVDGTAVGGCSFMIHVRHAAAAIESGLCRTVLITHGESGRSGIARSRPAVSPGSLQGQFELPYGPMGPPTLFTIPVLRYMKTYGTTEEQLAMVAVIRREWAAKNPRATFKDPVTVEDVLSSRMIAYPFRLLMCCLVTDGGGALILTAADRARDFPQKPVYLLGTGESVETPMVSQMEDFTSSRAFRVAGPTAFQEAGISHANVDHLMIYDAFAHLPIYGLEDRGLVHLGAQHGARRQAAAEHQRRRLVLHALGHVRHVRVAGERAPDARDRAGPGAGCENLGVPRCRRHVCRFRHDHHDERGALRERSVIQGRSSMRPWSAACCRPGQAGAIWRGPDIRRAPVCAAAPAGRAR